MNDVIYAFGLMEGAGLSAAQFDKLGINVLQIQHVYCTKRTSIPLEGLQPGDWAQFMNAPDCQNAMWENENVIVVQPAYSNWFSSSNGTYFGWRIGTQIYLDWADTLCDAYNRPISRWYFWEQASPWQIPLYQGQSWWLNMPMLSQMIFNVRTGATP
jgi:hypothetical protein